MTIAQNEKVKIINRDLNKLLDSFVAEWENARNKSWNEYITALPAGSRLPAMQDTIVRQEDRAAFLEKAVEYFNKADVLINSGRSMIIDELTKAPSEEAVRTIEMLKLRENISDIELKSLMDKYGDNPQTYNAIRSIAQKQERFIFPENIFDAELNRVDICRDNLRAFFNATGSKTVGRAYFVKMVIDEAFPAEGLLV